MGYFSAGLDISIISACTECLACKSNEKKPKLTLDLEIVIMPFTLQKFIVWNWFIKAGHLVFYIQRN
jgi:hypothetical protein